MTTPVLSLVAVIFIRIPPVTMMGALEAEFSLDWTGKIESCLMFISYSRVVGTTVSWAPVSAVESLLTLLPWW